MSPPVIDRYRTGASLAEALEQAASQRECIDTFRDEEESEDLTATLEALSFITRIGESRFCTIPLSYEDSQRIEQTLERTPFYVTIARFSDGEPFLATRLYRENFRETWQRERLEMNRELGGQFDACESPSFCRMVDEAVAWHVLHKDTEVRRCITCGKWFEALYVGRARFCADKCRKRFSAIAKLTPTFHCAVEKHAAATVDFSGLQFFEFEEKSRLIIESFSPDSESNACATWVHKLHSEWDPYITPLLRGSDRILV